MPPRPAPQDLSDAPEVPWWEFAAVTAACLFHVLANALFLGFDKALPIEDAPSRIIDSMGILDGDVGFNTGYPPLQFLVSAPFYAFLGTSIETARLSMSAFAVLYIVSMAWLGRQVTGPKGGVVSAIAAAGATWAAIYGRSYFNDVPLLATTALATAALVASHNYTRPRATVILGIAIGLGMLSRWTALFFTGAPLALAALPAIRKGWRPVSLLSATVVVGVLTALSIKYLGAAPHEGGFAATWTRALTGLDPLTTPVPTLAGAAELRLLPLVVALGIFGYKLRNHDAPRGRWNPAAGVSLAAAIALLSCLWWYLRAASGVYSKLHQQVAGWGHRDEMVSESWYLLADIAFTWWMMPLWMGIGLYLGFRNKEMRWPTTLCAVGLVVSLLLTGWLAPPTPRYIMPATTFALFLGFAWMGNYVRSTVAIATVGVLIAAIQIGWWHPALAGHTYPIDALIIQRGERKVYSQVRPADTVVVMPLAMGPQSQYFMAWDLIPATPPPNTESWPLEEAVHQASAAGTSLGIVGDTQSVHSRLEGNMFYLVSRAEGLPLQFERDDPESADNVIVIQAGYPDPPAIAKEYSWLKRWTFKACWSSQPPEGMAPTGSWCLFTKR